MVFPSNFLIFPRAKWVYFMRVGLWLEVCGGAGTGCLPTFIHFELNPMKQKFHLVSDTLKVSVPPFTIPFPSSIIIVLIKIA